MPNKNYLNGKARELRIKKALLESGFDIVIKAGGSKSPIDLVAIDIKSKKVLFIQAKPKSMSNAAKERINKEHSNLNDEFFCSFHTISTVKELGL